VLSLVLTILFAVSGGLGLLVGLVAQSILAVANLGLFRRTGLDPGPLPARPAGRRITLPWKLLPVAAAVAALVGSLFLYRELRDLETEHRAAIIAHRGASERAPENSLSAIRLAIEAGADWVEIDVQETQDGEVVVFHDRDFMRLGGDPLPVREVKPEQLAQIDIGSAFHPRFAGEAPITLDRALEFCGDRIGVLIELKFYGGEQRLEERVIDVVERRGMGDQVMIMSLKRESVERFRALRPEWKLGLLSTLALGDLTRFDVDFLAVNSRAATPRLLERARRTGRDVYVWTINEPAQISAMLSRGVDGIITDRPHEAFKVLRERARMNPGERLLVEIAARLDQPPPASDP
jgi:glycerophosphoryl diester phosphodiesterase